MSKAGTHDITIEKGATFNMIATWKDNAGDPIDLTGFTAAAMQVRSKKGSSDKIVDLTLGAGITLGGALGTVTVVISSGVTATIDETEGVYDLELTSAGGDVTRLLEGKVTISNNVTR